MNTFHENNLPDDEVNLLEILTQLWKAKMSILLVTGLCGLLGLGFLLLAPKYVGEVAFRGPVGARLSAFAPLNDAIKEHYDDSQQNPGVVKEATDRFEVSTDSLVSDMVRELQDFEEFEQALREHSAEVRGMSDEKYRDERSDFLSDFSIIPATKANPIARVVLEWHSEEQLLDILTATLTHAEANLNLNKTAFFKGLSENIERRTQDKLLGLDRELKSVMEVVDLATASRLLLLREQAAIARELDLAENNLAASGQDSQFLFNISSDSAAPRSPEQKALYLRGYKSLEKEIILMEGRTSEQKYLLDPNFLNVKRQLIEHKNSAAAELFQNALNTSPFVSDADIFGVARDAIRVSNKRSIPIILAFSLILGFFGSCAFFVIKSALLRHQNHATH